ncbi:PIN domain-containing protein [Asticcacaulis sp. EMRT-3]|uniref:PIN domain-containing protein n=1 Tax=Asticcacaulis sp. EMRT-3 TaxID=3040349 RepID=UPI0024AECE44|nr:PIN domain-containing protein [Asticcacaulis sp. EMRT-3]MDI7775948.1 PIN domain-containing protein [Asticcacaulis sp. EMRT-3]
MYLLDTGIMSALRHARWDAACAPLAQWARGITPARLFISAITLLELENGVAHVQKDRPDEAKALRVWLDNQVATTFDGRILPVDAAVVRRRCGLNYADGRDGLIAATALEHSLTLVTRRPSAYRAGRVRLLDPFAAHPASDAAPQESEWAGEARSGQGWLRNLFLRF